MAGEGSRYKNVGYTLPKPLIDVNGKPMIQVTLESLNLPGNNIFVVKKDHYTKFNLESLLSNIANGPCNIVQVDKTLGQADTALIAKSLINNDTPLLIVNCDNYFVWDSKALISKLEANPNICGAVISFTPSSKNPNWSYVSADKDGRVFSIAEKKQISNNALAGAFYWRKGSDFVKYCERMISNRLTINNEYFIAPVFNEAIMDGNYIYNHVIDSMVSMGSPEELNTFLEWQKSKEIQNKLNNVMSTKNSSVINPSKMKNVLDDIRMGRPIILVDEYDRENEGDIVIAAEKATVENLVFTMNHARGLMCIPAADHILKRLDIPPMVVSNTDKNQTPFTVSVDAIEGTTTGMSVHDRLKTISVLLDKNSKPTDLARPGHLFPLRAKDGLLKQRRGHTEGSLELLKLAGLQPMAIICEIMNLDGTMARGADLDKFAHIHGISIVSMEEVYEFAYNESI